MRLMHLYFLCYSFDRNMIIQQFAGEAERLIFSQQFSCYFYSNYFSFLNEYINSYSNSELVLSNKSLKKNHKKTNAG